MIDKETTDRAKRISLPAYLQGMGIAIPSQGGVIKSPFREDRHPSFSVFCTPDGVWMFVDHANDDRGSVIDFVMRIRNCGFVAAVQELLEFAWTNSLPAQVAVHKGCCHKEGVASGKKSKAKIDYRILPDNALAREYLLKTRKISQQALEGVGFYTLISRYKRYDNKYLAFRTIEGSYICRAMEAHNPCKELVVGSQGLWMHGDADSQKVYVFESAIDALSFKTMVGGQDLLFVSLNSVCNHKRLHDIEIKNKEVFLCLDADPAGDKATLNIIELLKGQGSIRDIRHKILGEAKDVNDALCGKNMDADVI